MDNLTGLVLDVGSRSHAQVLDAVRAAFLAAGYVPTEQPTALRVRVGQAARGLVLLTDDSVVTFDETVARTLAAQRCGALFAVRDYGYRKGKRVQRAAFLPLDGKTKWKRKPKRAQHADDVQRTVADLWPAPWDVETRAGTTLCFTPPATPTLFPPRDGEPQRREARLRNHADMLLNLRPRSKEQWPPESPCAVLSEWLPEPLPPEAEAIITCVSDEALRARAWVTLVGHLKSGTLTLDERSARLVRSLRITPPSFSEVERHRSNAAPELGVAWLLARCLQQPLPVLDDDARLAAGRVALEHDRLDLVEPLDLVKVARRRVKDAEPFDAAAAARLLSVLEPSALDLVEARARKDPAFAQHVGVHGALTLSRHNGEAALRLFDAVQPCVTTADNAAWTHALALWLTWTRHQARARTDVDAPARVQRRLELALQHAAEHKPSMVNALILARAVKDPASTAAASEALRSLDRKHPLLGKTR